MRFLYTTASLAFFAAAAQAYSTGSPVCKSDPGTLDTVAKAGKMGTQVEVATFAKTWEFVLWDDNGKAVSDGDSVMTNMDYWVTVKGGSYKGVMTYPMFDGSRIPMPKEADAVTLTAGDEDNFGSAAKCAGKVGQTITHTNSDEKDDKAKVAKVRVLDDQSGKFMMSGIVVTAKGKFGKAVTPEYSVMAGKNNPGGDDGGDGGDTDNGDNGGNTDDAGNGGTGGVSDGTGNNTDPAADPNDASSISFVRPVIALQLVALAAFVLI